MYAHIYTYIASTLSQELWTPLLRYAQKWTISWSGIRGPNWKPYGSDNECSTRKTS